MLPDGGDQEMVVDVSQAELAAINRLVDITGKEQEICAEIYLGCGKNEELAANILLEADGDDQ